MSTNGDFSQGRISSNIIRLTLPMLVAEFVHVLYNLVDRMFIGHIQGYGTQALTGVGIAFPIITVITAFASLFGQGGAPLCAIERGKKADGEAEKIMNTSYNMILLVSLLLTLLLFALRKKALMLVGANDDTIQYALDYFSIYLFGTPFVMISLGMNPFINVQGFSKRGMCTVLIGAICNIILDPIFIFAFKMGVKGAAIATDISQIISAIFVLCFLRGNKAVLKLKSFVIVPQYVKSILALGITGFTFKITNSVTQAIANATLAAHGGDLYIAGMSVIYSLREVVMLPISSITEGSRPVLSYNYGAKLTKRVKKSVQFVFGTTLAYNLTAWALLMFFSKYFIQIFTDDNQLIELTIPCLRIFFGTFFMMTFQMVGQNTFVSLNYPRQAVFFSLLRKLFLIVPLTLLLPLTSMGVLGVFYAEMFSQIIGGTCCFITMIFVIYRHL